MTGLWTNLLIAKMEVQFKKETQYRSNAHTIVELCDIYSVRL